jgi:hypothetical protein
VPQTVLQPVKSHRSPSDRQRIPSGSGFSFLATEASTCSHTLSSAEQAPLLKIDVHLRKQNAFAGPLVAISTGVVSSAKINAERSNRISVSRHGFWLPWKYVIAIADRQDVIFND